MWLFYILRTVFNIETDCHCINILNVYSGLHKLSLNFQIFFFPLPLRELMLKAKKKLF